MKLASLKTEHPDGKLVIVSQDQNHFVDAGDIAPTMQFTLENWTSCSAALITKYKRLNEGLEADSFLEPKDDIVVVDLKHGIDFEGEFHEH